MGFARIPHGMPSVAERQNLMGMLSLFRFKQACANRCRLVAFDSVSVLQKELTLWEKHLRNPKLWPIR